MQIERKRMVLIAAAGAAGLLAAAQCSVPAFAETVQSGWFTQGNKRYYAYEDGSLAVGTVVINEIPYVFAPNGAQQTGWQTVNGKRYFYTKDGEAQFGWIKWRGEHYYVSDDYGKLTDELVREHMEDLYLKIDGMSLEEVTERYAWFPKKIS